MARVNVYLPDELAAEAREAGLNVSSIAQAALRDALAACRMSAWIEVVRKLPPTGVTHEEAIAALDAAREEAGDVRPERQRGRRGA